MSKFSMGERIAMGLAETAARLEEERDEAQAIIQEYWQMIFELNADWDAFHKKLAALPYIPVTRG